METFQGKTMTQLLKARSKDPAKGIVFIEKNGKEEFLSYQELWIKASSVLHLLQEKGVHAGAELVIQLEDNETFLIVFWACVLGGIIAVPLSVGKTELNQQKLFHVWDMLIDPHLFTTPEILARNEKTITGALNTNVISGMRHRVIFDHEITADRESGTIYTADETDIAFLQFSSGSTGNAKGIILTHANLLANLEGIHRAARYTANDTSLSWMPLTHDMGLIGFHLNPVYSNMNQFLLPTSLFIVRPGIWLDKCSEHKITITCSPNFGYSYVLRHRVKEQADLDLSQIRIIYNGAEPISYDLCEEFLTAFEKWQLKRTAMCPVYGLAEATLAVSISNPLHEAEAFFISRQHTGVGEKIVAPIHSEDALTLVNVGIPIHTMQVRITDLKHQVLGEGIAGAIQICGPSVTAGFYNNPSATKAVKTTDGWLNTGDTGFIVNGSLYILGRIKDVLFVNGQNYYAHDLEKIAQEVNGIELNKIVIAGVFNQEQQRDEIIAFILYRNSLASFAELAASVNECVLRKTGFVIDTFIPVKEIPKTTSGKLQRYKLAEQYATGAFKDIVDELSRHTRQVAAFSEVNMAFTAEDRFLQLCRRALQQDTLQLTDHFLESGGNSLRAAALTMAVWKEFQAEITIEDIYTAETLQAIAVAIGQKKGTSQYLPLAKAPKASVYELASLQIGIYQYGSMHPESLLYNVPVFFKLNSGIDFVKLEQGIRELIHRHEALRTSFCTDAPGAMQVHEDAAFNLTIIEVPERDLQNRMLEQVQAFRLSDAPLLRASVLTDDCGASYFFLDVHHLIADGVSVTLLLKELSQWYTGALPVTPGVQYRDYCAWEKNQKESTLFARAKEFWKEYLAGDIPLLDMPTDFLRPPVFTGNGKKIIAALPVALTESVRILANEANLTIHSFFFTAYSLLLAKYTGQDELMIGIPVAGRLHPDLEHTIGMFVNSLPVNVKLTDTNNFITQWKEQSVELRKVIAHQQYPFSLLREDLNLRRDVSRNPVFDTMFVYQNMPLDFLENSSVFAKRIPVDASISKYDLTAEIIEDTNQFTLSFEYATDLFSERTMQRLLHYFIQLLHTITESTAIPLQSLSLQWKGQPVKSGTGGSASPFHRASTTVSHLLATTCLNHGGRIAIKCQDQVITYSTFGRLVNNAAAKLLQIGVRRGDVVALRGARTPSLLVAMHAVLKIGSCFLPVDPHIPDERVQYMLDNSRCRLLITDSDYLVNTRNERQVLLFSSLMEAEEAADLPVSCMPDDLCYILYTSGTTGLPKGVMIEHHSLVNYLEWGSLIYGKGLESAFPFFTSISFDLTLTSVFIPLLSGNTVVIYDDIADDFLLRNILDDNQVHIIKATPSHFRLLANNYIPRSDSRVRALIAGGEQLDTDLAHKLYQLFGGNVTIYNEYGPTEATIGCMTYSFNPLDSYQYVPVGVAAANTDIYVLDKHMMHVPIGVNGEIYIAGTCLARGYHHNEELTNEKFYTNPYRQGERMYRTGDIGRLLDFELITYCGRVDEQVKINGYRIELNEIQQQIKTNSHVEEAVVVVRNSAAGQPFLCAFYTCNETADVVALTRQLREDMVNRLPYYMVPSYFIRLDVMPLTRNKKTDTRFLELYELQTTETDSGIAETGIVASLLALWRDILKEPSLRATDNFFEYGGDSIKAIQIVSAARQNGIAVTVKDILTAHTVQHLAGYATILPQQGVSSPLREEGFKPLSPVEAWFMGHHLQYPGAYNQAMLLQCVEDIDVSFLKRTLIALIQHHDALRLNYNSLQHMLFFNPVPPEGRLLVLQNELHIPDQSPEKIIAASGLANHVFDLTKDLLIAASIVTTGNGNEYVYLVAHHLVTDGVSWHILLQDFQQIYRNLAAGLAEPVLVRTSISVKEWLVRASMRVRENENTAMRKLCKLADDCEFVIPDDHGSIDWRMLHARVVRRKISAGATDSLRKQGSTLFHTDMEMIIFLAVVQALQKWTGKDTFKLEAEAHGREIEGTDISATVGWFTEIYPVVIELKNDSLLNQLKDIKEQIKKGRTISSFYGFFNWADGDTRQLETQRPEIRLNYLGEFGVQDAKDLFRFVESGMRVQSVAENNMTAKMEINALIYQGELIVDLQYNATIHLEETAARFADGIQQNLKRLAEALSQEKEIHYTPSDFSGVELNEEEIDTLFN
ncbi:MAG: amino acid adenylation domain-containing protein [Bacteroidetes bacterium]|nr:amino acid adenylation domain-containing protein [Bacteroidota bacterium]